MEILNVILLIITNFLIVKFLLKRNYLNLWYALILALFFAILNLLFGQLPKSIIPLTLFYSFALLILSFVSSKIDVTKNSNLNLSEDPKDQFRKIKYYMANIIIPIFTTIFQIILMFDKEIQNKI